MEFNTDGRNVKDLKLDELGAGDVGVGEFGSSKVENCRTVRAVSGEVESEVGRMRVL